MKILWALVLVAMLLNTILVTYKWLEEQRRIREMVDILKDIESGKSKQKFLIVSTDELSILKDSVNRILYKYEEKIENYEALMYANQQLMTNLSHDLRTPITTLLGYLDAICMNLVDINKREEYIEAAKDKAYDLKGYVDTLFEWFRLNSNEEIFNIRLMDINELTREILKDWVPVLEENSIEYEIEISDKLTLVNIDTECYIRIINNIMQNTLSHSKANKVKIIVKQNEDKVYVVVSDNGIGISEQDMKYIFERLYKCDLSRHSKGSGLGLNITKKLVEKMNGTISISSQVGEGTSFSIALPGYKQE